MFASLCSQRRRGKARGHCGLARTDWAGLGPRAGVASLTKDRLGWPGRCDGEEVPHCRASYCSSVSKRQLEVESRSAAVAGPSPGAGSPSLSHCHRAGSCLSLAISHPALRLQVLISFRGLLCPVTGRPGSELPADSESVTVFKFTGKFPSSTALSHWQPGCQCQ